MNLVEKLSPDSLSVMEFESERDIEIAEKMLKFPLLGQKIDAAWNIVLAREFDMTNDSYLFERSYEKNRLPLFEGKMFHQYTDTWGKPQYWIDETKARDVLVGKHNTDERQILDYQHPRLGYREISATTNERTMIATVLPQNVFFNHKINWISISKSENFQVLDTLFLCSVFNSFAFDYLIRQRIGSGLSMFIIYQMPVPRLTTSQKYFSSIVTRAAKLICTTPEFDELAVAAGLKSHHDGITDATGRAQLRAELDGIVAHLYGLTETDFAHILTTFPLVDDAVKLAARNAFRDIERGILKTTTS